MAPDRRTFLAAALATLAGCPDGERAAPPSPTSTPSPTRAPSPEDYLPEPGDGWRLEDTGDYVWGPLGGTDGVRGYYTGPDGGQYEVLVMFSESYAEGSARSWACAGWQVALSLPGVAIAASTGTDQRTFTPERPPTMTRTPDPDRLDRVRALLVRSPRLAEADLREHRVECDR